MAAFAKIRCRMVIFRGSPGGCNRGLKESLSGLPPFNSLEEEKMVRNNSILSGSWPVCPLSAVGYFPGIWPVISAVRHNNFGGSFEKNPSFG